MNRESEGRKLAFVLYIRRVPCWDEDDEAVGFVCLQ